MCDISISANGTISVRNGNTNNDASRGKLKLVAFDDKQTPQLTKDASSTFAAPDGVTPQPDKTSRIVQGAVEGSNVRGVVEITRMIEITRSYTQVATMMQQLSDMGNSVIDKLADVPA